MTATLPCLCRSGAPVEHHHTAADGHLLKEPGDSSCDLCGGTGRARGARLRLARIQRVLAPLGLALWVSAGALGLACLLLGWSRQPAVSLAAAGAAALAGSGLIELYLARTVSGLR